MIPPPVFSLQTSEDFSAYFLKRSLLIGSTFVEICLTLSIFFLNGAEINCFEKLGVFTGREEQVILEFIIPTLGANIRGLGHVTWENQSIESS